MIKPPSGQEIMIRPMTEKDIDHVMVVENVCHPFPWTPDVFENCLKAGYQCWVVENNTQLIGMGVMMITEKVSHLLNIAIHPDFQHQGYAHQLLLHFLALAKKMGSLTMSLEVRISNTVAIGIYQELGFNEVDIRPDYYETEQGTEDAIVFAKHL